MQATAIAFDAGVILDRIGVQRGWRCLDLGCGAGGILELLGTRVGPTGLAIGLDAIARFPGPPASSRSSTTAALSFASSSLATNDRNPRAAEAEGAAPSVVCGICVGRQPNRPNATRNGQGEWVQIQPTV